VLIFAPVGKPFESSPLNFRDKVKEKSAEDIR